MFPNIGDRVMVGYKMFGVIQKIAPDKEVKVLLDGDTVGMYYHPTAVAEIPKVSIKEEA